MQWLQWPWPLLLLLLMNDTWFAFGAQVLDRDAVEVDADGSIEDIAFELGYGQVSPEPRKKGKSITRREQTLKSRGHDTPQATAAVVQVDAKGEVVETDQTASDEMPETLGLKITSLVSPITESIFYNFQCPVHKTGFSGKDMLDQMTYEYCGYKHEDHRSATFFYYTISQKNETVWPQCFSYCSSCKTGFCSQNGTRLICKDEKLCRICDYPKGCNFKLPLASGKIVEEDQRDEKSGGSGVDSKYESQKSAGVEKEEEKTEKSAVPSTTNSITTSSSGSSSPTQTEALTSTEVPTEAPTEAPAEAPAEAKSEAPKDENSWYTGTLSFIAKGVTKTQVETATIKTLAKKLILPTAAFKAEATAADGFMRLFAEAPSEFSQPEGSWSVTFEVSAPPDKVATIDAEVKELEADTTILTNEMGIQLQAAGASQAAVASLDVQSFKSSREAEPKGDKKGEEKEGETAWKDHKNAGCRKIHSSSWTIAMMSIAFVVHVLPIAI